ncbi:MAG: tyrosine-type recombinase/integrase [Bacillota bacterium]
MLVQCPECELQVSEKAISCPHCGYPFQSGSTTRQKKTRRRRRLPNGFGQISEIKNRNLRKPFRAMVTVGKTDTGRPIAKPLQPESYFATYNEAYTALLEYNRNPYSLTPSITVAELYEKWSVDYYETIGKGTITATIDAWQYCSEIYSMRVLDIRARHIKGCLENGTHTVNGIIKRTTPNLKNKIKTIFNLLFDYAVEYEIADKNYARTFTLDKEIFEQISNTQKQHMSFTDEEMDRLWNNVDKNEFIELILVQCYSGWRPQELCQLKVEDVDLENGLFMGGMKTKAGTNRQIPIHSKIQHFVEKRYNEASDSNNEFLFTYQVNKKQKPITYSKYARMFRMIKEQLPLNDGHRPHDGRKHFVTTAKKYNVNEYAIKYIVGHAISDITEKIYTDREFDWLITEMEKIK